MRKFPLFRVWVMRRSTKSAQESPCPLDTPERAFSPCGVVFEILNIQTILDRQARVLPPPRRPPPAHTCDRRHNRSGQTGCTIKSPCRPASGPPPFPATPKGRPSQASGTQPDPPPPTPIPHAETTPVNHPDDSPPPPPPPASHILEQFPSPLNNYPVNN